MASGAVSQLCCQLRTLGSEQHISTAPTETTITSDLHERIFRGNTVLGQRVLPPHIHSLRKIHSPRPARIGRAGRGEHGRGGLSPLRLLLPSVFPSADTAASKSLVNDSNYQIQSLIRTPLSRVCCRRDACLCPHVSLPARPPAAVRPRRARARLTEPVQAPRPTQGGDQPPHAALSRDGCGGAAAFAPGVPCPRTHRLRPCGRRSRRRSRRSRRGQVPARS